MNAPSNAKAPVTEMIHGTSVTDRYRWLEDPDSPWTRRWLADQKVRFNTYFADLPHLSSLRARVKDYLDIPVIDQAVRTDSCLIYRCRKPTMEQASIYARDVATGVERVLVNSSLQDPFTSYSIYRASDDGARLAFGVRAGGTDARAIKVIDVRSGCTLPFELPAGTTRGFAFTPTIDGVFYCHDWTPISAEHLVRFHSFGKPSSEDPIVFRVKRTAHSRLLLISDDVHLGVVYRHDDGSRIAIDLYVAPYETRPQWRPVFANKPVPMSPLLISGRVFLLTGTNGSPASITEVAPDGRHVRTVLPESSISVMQVEMTVDSFYVTSSIEEKTYVHRWSLDGDRAKILDLPQDGTIRLHPPLTNTPASLHLTYESFVRLPRLIEYRPALGATVVSSENLPISITDRTSVQRQNYVSRDGTEIPISLLSPDNARHRAIPTLLSAYGGFGVSITPQFSVLATIFVENGACFATPNVRGGTEKGPQWHDAARGRNRQKAFDDFIAAAEWLIEREITLPRRLAICGASNAGLLVGAVMTQRPELFKAVLCIAPLLDMVRYEHFDNAKRWVGEYGTSDNVEDFMALFSYSPYHRVSDAVDYPATLFVTGARDERCNPAHVRKMAARLQDRSVQSFPILVDYSLQRGHAPALPLSIRIEALAIRLAFLFKELDIIPRRLS
jgi:prolyl oligopeptidase